MLEFESMEELRARLNMEQTKNIYAEQEARETLEELRAERLRQQIEIERAKEERRSAQERQKREDMERRAKQAEESARRRQKSDFMIYAVSIGVTLASVFFSFVILLVIISKY